MPTQQDYENLSAEVARKLEKANKSYEGYKAGNVSWEDYQIDQRAMCEADTELIEIEMALGIEGN